MLLSSTTTTSRTELATNPEPRRTTFHDIVFKVALRSDPAPLWLVVTWFSLVYRRETDKNEPKRTSTTRHSVPPLHLPKTPVCSLISLFSLALIVTLPSPSFLFSVCRFPSLVLRPFPLAQLSSKSEKLNCSTRQKLGRSQITPQTPSFPFLPLPLI